jgi:hypothetical protein
MVLALSVMDPVVQGIFFLVAVVLFVIAAFFGFSAYATRDGHPTARINLVALGLACFAFPFMWNAFAASGS